MTPFCIYVRMNVLQSFFCVLFSLSLLSCDNKNDVPISTRDGSISKEDVQGILPFYLTYLRLHQEETIKDPEIMGGTSWARVANGNIYTCVASFPVIMPDSYPYESLKLFYITGKSNQIQKAKVKWCPKAYKNVRIGNVMLNLPNDKKTISNELYMSTDKKKWYEYLVIDYGMFMEFVKTTPLPMKIDPHTGLPIPIEDEIINKTREKE